MAHSEVKVSVLIAGSKALQSVVHHQPWWVVWNPNVDLWEFSVGKIIQSGCHSFRQIITNSVFD